MSNNQVWGAEKNKNSNKQIVFLIARWEFENRLVTISYFGDSLLPTPVSVVELKGSKKWRSSATTKHL